MSVVVQNQRGSVLDPRSLIDQGYSRCIRRIDNNQTSREKFRLKRRWFRISTRQTAEDGGPMEGTKTTDRQTAEDGGPMEGTKTTDRPVKKRKRRLSELNQGEVDSQALHQKIRSVVLEGTRSLVDCARSLGHLNGVTDTEKDGPPSLDCSLAALCEMAKELPLVDDEDQDQDQDRWVQPLVAEDGSTSHVDLFSRVTENSSDWAAVVQLMGEDYVIPPHSSFLLSDFTRIQPLVQHGRRFELIVMDPPWENKSVKRSRRYSCLPSSQLKQLQMSRLASPDCLVVTWVTNRPSHLRFVRDQLYPHWGVEVTAQWFWVKVTTSGQFVFPLDSRHKKPYEVLVLGRYRSSAENSASCPERSEVRVEDQRLIVSVPSALHSQKPPLSEVLKPYVGPEARCLELFARSLQPGWTSWGNEVLKFQRSSYFTTTPPDDGADVPEDEAAEDTVTES